MDRKKVTARIVEQVPRVDPGVRRIGYRCQRGNTKPSRVATIALHDAYSVFWWVVAEGEDPRAFADLAKPS
jgi:hypothetical protein